MQMHSGDLREQLLLYFQILLLERKGKKCAFHKIVEDTGMSEKDLFATGNYWRAI